MKTIRLFFSALLALSILGADAEESVKPPRPPDGLFPDNPSAPIIVAAGTAASHNVVHVSGAEHTNTAVSCGREFTILLKPDGTVWTCGLVLASPSFPANEKLVKINGLSDIIAVSAGQSAGLALRSDGTVWAWGFYKPRKIAGLSEITAIAAGGQHNLALKSDGTVWAWGKNSFGQLGNGTNEESSDVVQVTGLTDVTAISASVSTSAALRKDGTVWVWGDRQCMVLDPRKMAAPKSSKDKNDALGIDVAPAKIANLSNAIAISIGSGFGLALKSNGMVYAWGGPRSELGGNIAKSLGAVNGKDYGPDTTASIKYSGPNTAVLVAGLSKVVGISAGQSAAFALKSDGTVWAWGSEVVTSAPSCNAFTPHVVPDLSDVFFVTASKYDKFQMAVKRDNTIWAWGLNHGAFGNKTKNLLVRCPVPALLE